MKIIIDDRKFKFGHSHYQMPLNFYYMILYDLHGNLVLNPCDLEHLSHVSLPSLIRILLFELYTIHISRSEKTQTTLIIKLHILMLNHKK